MNIFNLTRINIKKLSIHKAKALFLIIPIGILIFLTVIVTSQIKNIEQAMNETVFGTIEEQSTQLVLNKSGESSGNNFGPSFFNSDNQYTQDDVDKINQIEGVESASLHTEIPISNIKSSNLFEDIDYTFSNLSELNSLNATLYTEENFEYVDGEAIPIILNASSFIETYEDWQGKTEIELNLSGNRMQPPFDINALSTPTKTRAIEYSESDLIGKEFTISFGGLDSIQSFKVEQSAGAIKFVKLTEDEINTKISERRDTVDDYWDYEKISTPVTYTFKVVGIIKDSSINESYIPADFTEVLMSSYFQNQQNARNGNEIPTSLLNSTYTGLTFNGTELSNQSNGFGGGQMRLPFGPGQNSGNSNSESYNIPGLVIETEEDGSGSVVGVYSDINVYNNAAKKAESISVKLVDIYAREDVVKSLNRIGYAYQDLNNLEVFSNLRYTISVIALGLIVSFIIITILVIIFAMSKFVSDSRKEIGIFRAIGMRKLTIVALFTGQALLYTLFGYVVGLALGLGVNMIVGGVVESWFNSFVNQTISQTFNVVNKVESTIFSGLDTQSILLYSLGLFVLTILISLIPAFKASSISPVEAIKGE